MNIKSLLIKLFYKIKKRYCPKCGTVMSPFVSFCPNCTKQNFEITCTADNSNIKSSFDVQQFIGGRKDKLGYE